MSKWESSRTQGRRWTVRVGGVDHLRDTGLTSMKRGVMLGLQQRRGCVDDTFGPGVIL